ncbi:hypothetical protein Cgig2_027332 [Carnegiea gigantea]|uniref:Uncharacterized protein n=1 Tax=Carnegiea gigantea TaxID=171969 RepID=A0A9Q1GNB1_9CARY|nr:hypothetical protein Cgig2_027332 [Carnegiea gigantea]
MDAKDIVDAVMKNYSVELKKHVARRARRIMLFQIKGRHDLSYLKLAHYIEMVKTIANAYNIWDNEEALHQLQEASRAAYAWLMKEPKEHWARYLFDKSSASVDNSLNFVESFNKVINTLREKPILNLLEGIRKQVMTWIATRKGEAESWEGKVVPTVRQKLKKIRKEAWTCDAIPNGHMQFDVQDQQGVNYVVDLNLKKWDRVRSPEEGRKRPTKSRRVRCSKCNGLHHNSLTCKSQGNKPSIRIRKRPAPSDGTGQKYRGRPRKQAPVSTVCQPSSTEPPSSQPASTQPSSSQPSSAQPSSIQPMRGN